jgi:hypothetical protein
MHRVLFWSRIWGAVLMMTLVGTAVARAEGFWVTLAAGLAGGSVPTTLSFGLIRSMVRR